MARFSSTHLTKCCLSILGGALRNRTSCQPPTLLWLRLYRPQAGKGSVKLGGDGVSRTHSAVRRRIYSPLGLPIFLHLHKLGAPNRNWTCLRLASNPARNKTSPGHNLVVDRGIEPLLPTWKAGVLTDRRIHQKYHCTHNLKMGSKALLGTVIQTYMKTH